MSRQFASGRRGFLFGVAALAIAPVARADELSVAVDTHYAPDLAGWGATLEALCRGWWPRINRELASPGFTPPPRVEIVLAKVQPDRVAAVERGGRIYVDADHVRANRDTGFIAHELVHVAQHYPDGQVAWLSEGIADYLRYYVLLPKDPQRSFPSNITYAVGYQPAAALLDFAERRYGPGVVKAVNAAMRSGHDGEAALTLATGQTPAGLWARFTAFRAKAAAHG